jgi:hypothetical protein
MMMMVIRREKKFKNATCSGFIAKFVSYHREIKLET